MKGSRTVASHVSHPERVLKTQIGDSKRDARRSPVFYHEADELQGSVLRYTDAIAAHQVGITNTVATVGTALTTNHTAGALT